GRGPFVAVHEVGLVGVVGAAGHQHAAVGQLGDVGAERAAFLVGPVVGRRAGLLRRTAELAPLRPDEAVTGAAGRAEVAEGIAVGAGGTGLHLRVPRRAALGRRRRPLRAGTPQVQDPDA